MPDFNLALMQFGCSNFLGHVEFFKHFNELGEPKIFYNNGRQTVEAFDNNLKMWTIRGSFPHVQMKINAKLKLRFADEQFLMIKI